MITGKGRPAQRGTKRRRISNHMWGGSRFYTNRAIEFIDKVRSPNPVITSRKRFQIFGNSRSDHSVKNLRADAVDFDLIEDHDAATKLAKHLGWGGTGQIPDFSTWTTERKGKRYQHQVIAKDHGTGPHLHYGLHRI